MARSSGFPQADAQSDFLRARRRRSLAELSRRLRREPGDIDLILPFEEVVRALGRKGERNLGRQVIDLDTIVGTVDRTKGFDRRFRPTSPAVRVRWEQIAAAMRRGDALPPISVYRIGRLHFVRDGHHRVSVSRALGRDEIDALITEVHTKLDADTGIRPGDLPLKDHERVFLERVPLTPEQHSQLQITDRWRYAGLAEGIEAWGFRCMQGTGTFMDRRSVAQAWFADEYLPIVEAIREASLAEPGESDTEAYMRVVSERYRIMRSHGWDDEVVERLQQ